MLGFDNLHCHVLAILGSPAAQLELAGQLTDQASFLLLKRAVNKSVPAAWYQVGRAYLLGRGVPASLSTALRWLARAAEANDVNAQTLLASLALAGTCDTTHMGLFEATSAVSDPDQNCRVALHWAERAAAQGSAEADAIVGYVLTGGPEDLRDRTRGEHCYQSSAAAGSAQGQLGWALILLGRNTVESTREASDLLENGAAATLPTGRYIRGAIGESGAIGTQDFAVAAEHYRVAALAGHRSAQLRYGIALLTGRGVGVDLFEGESWLRRAALAGEPAAAALVGELYVAEGELPPNYVEAAMWLRRAAEAGHAGAAKTLGRLLLGGTGLAPDLREAAGWLRLAIASGYIEARNDLAQLALTGQVPEADQQTTCRWFQEQAAAGDPAAAFNLGLCLAEGVGAPRDDARALALFERAAVTIAEAQYWCGRMHAEGRGCPPDSQAARVWFLRAAALGNPDAEALAGEMLFNGRGGPPDKTLAIRLFKRAAATGHRGAIFALNAVNAAAG